MHCTIALLNLSPNVETVSTMRAIHHLVQEAGQAFLQAHRNLINAELAIIREEGGREAEKAYLVDLLENMDGPSEGSVRTQEKTWHGDPQWGMLVESSHLMRSVL